MPQSGFLKPRIVDVQNLSPNHARVTMEPFERGYGHTLGNALRRVLLSSMPGYAPTEVQIAGVVHEYSTLDGVREDVVDILLNLKGVVFRLHNRAEAILSLKKKGEGPVTAADIEPAHDVEIVNPDHVIAHLAAGGKLEMQIKVESGRGYVPGNMRYLPEETKGIGRIVLDASFSPVRRVSYAVESARVEQRTDLDKLIMDIETNGAIEPEEAIRYAARVLVDQLSVFAQLEGTALPDRAAEVAGGRSDPAAPGRRPGAHRALGQLPQGREHLLHRRPDPAHRDRAAEDAEPRPQVAQRDQGSARLARPHARHEARELAAGRARAQDLKKEAKGISHASRQRTPQAQPHLEPPARDAAQHDGIAAAARGDHDHAAQGEGAAPRGRADDHARQEAVARQPAPRLSTGCATARSSSKLFDDLGPRYAKRNGGYLRILKTGFRKGDNAPLALVSLLDRAEAAPAKPEEGKAAKKAKKAEAAQAS